MSFNRNKIKIFFLLFSLILTGCSTASYIVKNKSQTIGLDFTKGKWLLNEIDCPNSVYKQLKDKVNNDFGRILGIRFFQTGYVNSIILPKKIEINPSKEVLKKINIGCKGYDYLINIKAIIIKEEFGGVDITSSNFKTEKVNQSEVILEVYDINLSEIIYSQRISGRVKLLESRSDVNFPKDSNMLIIGSYKKLMKLLEKKSIN